VLQGVFCQAHQAMQGVLGEVTIADVFRQVQVHGGTGCAGTAKEFAGARAQHA
jgi:hypothetical protein